MSSFLVQTAVVRLFLLGVVFWFPFALSSSCAEIASKFGTWKSEGDAPPSYLSPTVDLLDGLDRIRKKIINGTISSQYDFDNLLHRLISQANDGHLQIGLCSREIFRFQHGTPLTSVSREGLDLPQLYVHSDAVIMHSGQVEAISPVVEINGLEADYYLQSRIAVTLGYQDPDARYNALFPSPSAGFTGTYSAGAWASNSGEWPGSAVLTIRFANGTRLEVKPTATWPATNGPMNYTDGQALFEAACLPGTSSKYIFGSFPGMYLGLPAYELPRSGPSVFPAPTIKDSNGLVRLYSLEDAALQDVAVLQITSFRIGGEDSREFSATIRQSLDWASSHGKTKLLLDLSGNEGGNVIPGFDLFRMLFPDEPIRSETRFRSTELLDVLGQAFSAEYRGADAKEILDPPLAAQNAVSPDQEENVFGSWKDLFGPDPNYEGDSMSNAYAVFSFAAASTTFEPISGYGSAPLAIKTRLFEPQSIAVVTDGRCASTCAIVVGLLQAQGVRTVTFGGRPRKAPMQAVGGVKGGQRWSLRTISRHIKTARELLAKQYTSTAAQANSTRRLAVGHLLQKLNDLAPPALPLIPRMEDNEWEFALRFDTYGQSSVNFRDAYVPANETTPWQFIYEAADCRMFLTPENVVDPASRWNSAARAMFGGREMGSEKCVDYVSV
uniref:Peptidase S41 family protein phomP1 n=1 Tax=Diaporthe leptostromiformis TaxID=291059 RepID=PHP11_DIALO|nr:RecName: Full=Peptidase S41 family protein phomP1; AltName: Full=Phomopsin biosynthesis cluster protein P1; Flags: Precursor [Diaporthe leptostromiformis]BDA39140.1 peptidase family S41 [Diaporthe leptostromiformis]